MTSLKCSSAIVRCSAAAAPTQSTLNHEQNGHGYICINADMVGTAAMAADQEPYPAARLGVGF